MIRSELLVAEISELGAELIRPQDRDGTDLIWNGSKEWWTGARPFLRAKNARSDAGVAGRYADQRR